MKTYLTITVALLFFMIACTNHSEEDKTISYLNEKLEQSNEALEQASLWQYKALNTKTNDPAIAERARMWYDKATVVRAASGKLFQQIEEQKAELLQKTNENNTTGKIDESKFQQIITGFKNLNTSIDSSLPELSIRDSAQKNMDQQAEIFNRIRKEKSAPRIVMLLSGLESHLRQIEFRTTEFALSKVSEVAISFSITGSIPKYAGEIPPGKNLNIQIDVKDRATQKPVVMVEGKPAVVKDGIAVYSKKAEREGNNTIPVSIEFTTEDGKKETEKYAIEFTVTAAKKS